MTNAAPERHLHAVPDEANTRLLADLPAERATLGAMLLSQDIADDISEILAAGDFYQPAHATIYAAIVRAMMLGEPTDAVTLTSTLLKAGDLERVGGAEYLHTLVDAVPVAVNGPWYARAVADFAARRRLAEAAIRIAQLAERTDGEVAEAVNAAQAVLHRATVRRESSTVDAVGDLIDPLFDELRTLEEGGRHPGLSTGLGTLDDVLGGLMPGQLVIVAGRPSMGKSTLALDFARSASRRGRSVLFISLEMAKGEVMRRMVSAEGEIDLSRLMRARLTPDDWARGKAVRDQIAVRPLRVDRPTRTDLASIRAAARRTQQQHGLDLLVVDYLQLVTTGLKHESRNVEVGEISRSLKLLAGELSIPIVAAAQLNRQSEHRADRRPQLSDLRESGSVEADADVVLLLHRPDYYDQECPRAGEADLIVAKNRNGPTETVSVAAQLVFSRFVDMGVS